MSFLDKIFGEKIENENKTKPFHENKNDDERIDWFRRTRPWHKVDKRIIEAIVQKFGENPIFAVFVVRSMQHNLVNHYCRFNNKPELYPEVVCSLISNILYDFGSNSLKQALILFEDLNRNQENFKHHYKIAMDMFETCIVLEEDQVSAYFGLAIARIMLNKKEDSLMYAKKGLMIIRKIKESNPPFHLSKIPDVKNAMSSFEEIERNLTNLISDIEGKR